MYFTCSPSAVNYYIGKQYIKQFFFNIDKNKSCFICRFILLHFVYAFDLKILYENKLDGSLPKPSEIDVNNIIYVPTCIIHAILVL